MPYSFIRRFNVPVFSSIAITVTFCIFILLTGSYIATRRLSWLIKNRGLLLGIIAVLGIIVYSIGYLASKECGKSIGDCITAGLMAIFSTGRMFVLENDIGELNQDGLTPEFRIAFGLVMTLAMLIIIMVALSIFGFSFLSSLRIRLLRIFGTRRTVYIFSSLSKRTLALEQDIKKNDAHALVLFLIAPQKEDRDTDERQLLKAAAENNTFVFVSEQEDGKPDTESVKDKQTAKQESESFNPKQIRKALREMGIFRSLKKTTAHFLAFNSNLALNAQVFLKLSKLLKSSDMNEQVTLHILTDETLYGHIFDNPELAGVNYIPLDLNALASHDLISKRPIIKGKFTDGLVKGRLVVMIVGESPVVPFLLKDIITQGQFFDMKPELIIVSERASDLRAHFFADNPEAKRFVTLSGKDILPGSAAFFDYYLSIHQDVNMVICAGKSDDFNIRLVKTLKNITNAARSQAKFCALTRSADTKIALDGTDILTFGDESVIEQAAVVIDEQADRMSKAVHEYYRRIYNDERTWQRVAYYERASSRALAMHIPSKLHVLGLQTEECNDSCEEPEAFAALISSNPQVLENLSIGEHRRWCAHLATHGWTLPLQEDEFKKSNALKQHPCLVDWDNLDRVSDAHSTEEKRIDYKEIDRRLIANLAEIAKYGHMKIVIKKSE